MESRIIFAFRQFYGGSSASVPLIFVPVVGRHHFDRVNWTSLDPVMGKGRCRLFSRALSLARNRRQSHNEQDGQGSMRPDSTYNSFDNA
eukprot:scaffold253501_cov31-Tisochrysis_lutea.AAC.5